MAEEATVVRKGARRMQDVEAAVLALLASGETESVNLMEWLAADMSALAANVARKLPAGPLAKALAAVSPSLAGETVTKRLTMLGKAISASGVSMEDGHFVLLAKHRSDLVRQWACYAVNERFGETALDVHLERNKPFAADPNMSVREVAWMAFRPRLQRQLSAGLEQLAALARDPDPNVRRFAVEVTRPRSVWGAHIEGLKRDPAAASAILEQVKADPSRYVQLAAGNWLNDASKTRGDWVLALCERWMADGPPASTRHIVRRALRTLKTRRSSEPLLVTASWPAVLETA